MNIAILGGSLGGLNAALWLRAAGHSVDVYERSLRPLTGLGAGIVLNPATVRWFTAHGGIDLDAVSVTTSALRYLDADSRVSHALPVRYRFTSYNALYTGLLAAFGMDRYHLGKSGANIDECGRLMLADGVVVSPDLVVCADGIRSSGRRVVDPTAALTYAGYLAWRGLVDIEDAGAFAQAITYAVLPNSHMLVYPIPGRSPGDPPQLNWLWYRNLPRGQAWDALMTDREGVLREASLGPGAVRDETLAGLRRDAVAVLPRDLSQLVQRTAQPFVQPIFDCEVAEMRRGRVAVLGDAAFVARPHAAAGSAKAAEDGFQLAQHLTLAADVDPALDAWQKAQLALGRSVLHRTRQAGQRAQIDSTWHAGDPLPFGLYAQGDSVVTSFSD
jgi:2,6-dihydroxypyridine 3-monooxygenase